MMVLKNFIGYKNGEAIEPLCITLPQIREFVKYFETIKKHFIFSWWSCNFDIQQNLEIN